MISHGFIFKWNFTIFCNCYANIPITLMVFSFLPKKNVHFISKKFSLSNSYRRPYYTFSGNTSSMSLQSSLRFSRVTLTLSINAKYFCIIFNLEEIYGVFFSTKKWRALYFMPFINQACYKIIELCISTKYKVMVLYWFTKAS